MVGTGAGRQRVDEVGQEGVDLDPEASGLWRGAAEDVPLLVAAATERGHQGRADRPDRLPEVALQHAVELDRLPGGDPDGPVAPAAGDAVVGQVPLGADQPARDPGPDHHLPLLVEAAGAGLLAPVAVVLLVDAVELQELGGVLAELFAGRRQLTGDLAPQVVAGGLDPLHLGDRRPVVLDGVVVD